MLCNNSITLLHLFMLRRLGSNKIEIEIKQVNLNWGKNTAEVDYSPSIC